MFVGPVFLVGGGPTPVEAAKEFIRFVGSDGILVIGEVRENPSDAMASFDFLTENGAKLVIVSAHETPTAQNRETIAGLLQGTIKGVWVPGGNQNLISERLGAEWFGTQIRRLLARGGAYFGTSAGAMILSPTMISGNGEKPGTSTIAPGANVIPILVDTHARERNRFGRLRDALGQSGLNRGLALSEGEFGVWVYGRWRPRFGRPQWIHRKS